MTVDALRGILKKYWGYDDFRPLQAEAMRAVVEGRDSVVVLPTGGGKSLCFQAPALQLPGLGVVVSPLISLMKDQVDALADCGVPAACVNSTLSHEERRRVADEVRSGRLKLLYLSPERLMTERTMAFLQSSPLSFFAIDEAHCISEWGHDFRPEYRMLKTLKQVFPETAIHAYTATATPRVRGDIARELGLADPDMLVGSFDRPNLIYRVQRRSDLLRQIREVVDRHPNDSGLIYCIRRKDVEEVAGALAAGGYDALPYHAGMSDHDRKRHQEAFINDRAKIIVATVAFGMGIDKSNVRYVIHAAAPKSLEAYQQETGRAGRDGLDAECWLFHTDNDFNIWRRLQSELPPQAFEVAMTVLRGMQDFTSALSCRHQAISRYFGQNLGRADCGACDVCLSEVDLVADALVISQKILSCVVRLKEGFGGEYTAQVLAGSREQRILDNGHDKLSTWGLLSHEDKKSIRDWIEQLVGQGYLANQPFRRGEKSYTTLAVTPEGRRVLKGEVTPRLAKPAKTRKEAKVATASWEGVDRGLFEALRVWRKAKSEERGIPPFVVFGDATLRELARYRPSGIESLQSIHGIGQKKSADYGADVVAVIESYCRENSIEMNIAAPPGEGTEQRERNMAAAIPKSSVSRSLAFEMFAQGKSLEEVREATGRAESTVGDYLAAFIEQEGICDPGTWVEEEVFERIRQAAEQTGVERLKPIFEALEGTIDYGRIRVAIACMKNAAPEAAQPG
ncbi:MAG: DNA helicase RecQ [Planctomycetaceae bacterium]